MLTGQYRLICVPQQGHDLHPYENSSVPMHRILDSQIRISIKVCYNCDVLVTLNNKSFCC